ncbi:MAG TPA: tetratricopeptide repeat protein [Candidatus Methylomirabilis sp.]|nr:tetratricopeptide repeat protein [Candidatus Methylomirabilis sp.]
MEKRKGLQAALAYVQQGKLDKAIAEYEAILRTDAKNPNVLNALGDLSARIGNKAEAIGYFKRLGEAYRVDGLFVRAISVYKKVLKLDPLNLEASLSCADMYAEQGITPEAKMQYQGLLDQFLRKGDVPGALEICEKLIRLEPGQQATIAKAAGVLARPGRAEQLLPKLQAIEERFVAAGQTQDIRQVYVKAAELLRTQRREADARFYTERLHYLDPAKAAAKIDEALEAVFPGGEERSTLEILPGPAEEPEPSPALELTQDIGGWLDRKEDVAAEERLVPDESEALQIFPSAGEVDTGDEAEPATIELNPEETLGDLSGLVERPAEPVTRRVAPQKLAEELQEARFYLKQGMAQEARVILQGILRRDPEQAVAQQLLAEVDRLAPAPREEPPVRPRREGPVFRVTDAKAPSGEYVDLAGELSQELDREETRLPPGLEPEVKRMLHELEQGIRNQLEVTDYETHYNLGIAYKDLELYDSAIGELRLAANDFTYRVRCAGLLGLCFLAKGEPEPAVEELLKGLAATQAGTEERWGILYDLATAYEAFGNPQKALESLLAVQNEMPKFRDVRARIRDLRDRLGPGGGPSQKGKR